MTENTENTDTEKIAFLQEDIFQLKEQLKNQQIIIDNLAKIVMDQITEKQHILTSYDMFFREQTKSLPRNEIYQHLHTLQEKWSQMSNNDQDKYKDKAVLRNAEVFYKNKQLKYNIIEQLKTTNTSSTSVQDSSWESLSPTEQDSYIQIVKEKMRITKKDPNKGIIQRLLDGEI